MTVALMLVLCIGTAIEDSSATGSEPPDSTTDASKPEAAAEPVAAKAEDFKLPPGFFKKTRGKYVLYCKRDAAMGTRLRTETCYDEAGMRDYLLALAENKRDIDRMRATCATLCACGQPEAC
jgi:hypothetical protein